jgi:hypothetical protein
VFCRRAVIFHYSLGREEDEVTKILVEKADGVIISFSFEYNRKFFKTDPIPLILLEAMASEEKFTS